MIKAIVYVSGGVVQSYIANVEGLELMIVDYDNEAAGDSPKDRSFNPVTVDEELFDRTLAGTEIH